MLVKIAIAAALVTTVVCDTLLRSETSDTKLFKLYQASILIQQPTAISACDGLGGKLAQFLTVSDFDAGYRLIQGAREAAQVAPGQLIGFDLVKDSTVCMDFVCPYYWGRGPGGVPEGTALLTQWQWTGDFGTQAPWNGEPTADFASIVVPVDENDDLWWTGQNNDNNLELYVCEFAFCTCANVGEAPTCTGTATGTSFQIVCTIPYQDDKQVYFAAEGLTPSNLDQSAAGAGQFSRSRVPDAGGFVSNTCFNPSTPRFFAPSGQQWTYSYSESTCAVVATLNFAPNALPTSFLFSNNSAAVAITTSGGFNVITVPVGIAVATQISETDRIVSNFLFTFYARLPIQLQASATRYALKLFKLSDNNRAANVAFTAVVMGGLSGNHFLVDESGDRPVFTYTSSITPGPLTCTVNSGIYVECGPFYDSSSSPVSVEGYLTVNAQCSGEGCIKRQLTLNVNFLLGDSESTLTGEWSALSPLIWRRIGDPDTSDVELTNDVIVGGDTLIQSLHFDAGSVSTITQLYVKVTGFTGEGATLTEYSDALNNNVFAIDVSGTALATTHYYNQLQLTELAAYFNFPSPYDTSINFAVQFAWPSELDVSYRGTFQIYSFFDVTIDARRRLANDQHLMVTGTSANVGDANGEAVVVIENSAAVAKLSMVLVVVMLFSMIGL